MLGSNLKDINVKRIQDRLGPRVGRSDVCDKSTPGMGALSKYSSSPSSPPSPAVTDGRTSDATGSGAVTKAATASVKSSPSKSAALAAMGDRKSVVEGTRESVRGDLGGPWI